MNIDYLREFVVLAETLNYQEAAERLFLAQSALSKHIRTMERELGHPLFHRTTRKVTLSDSGSLLLPYARQIAQLQQAYISVLEQAEHRQETMLKIGSIPLMTPYHISDRLAEFKEHHREVSLQIIENDSRDLIQLLRKGQCELAFLRLDPHFFSAPEDMEHIPFTSDHLCALIREDHPRINGSTIRLSELSEEEFLLFQENSQMNGFSRYACEKEGFHPRVSFNGHRPENLADLAARGLGTALLMKKQALDLPQTGLRLLDLEPEYSNTIELCYRKNRPLSPAAEAFIHFIKS